MDVSRDWTQLNHDVVFGKAGGKIIWQPRIGCWLTDKQFAGERLPEPYDGMTLPEIHRALDCSARLYYLNACFTRVPDPREHIRQVERSDGLLEYLIETPVGTQTAIWRPTPTSPHPIHEKWEVSTEEELRVAAWRERHCAWAWDQAQFDAITEEWRGLGAPIMFMPRMNVQALYIEKMGVQNGLYAIYDWPAAVEDYFDAVDESHDRLMDVINASPVNIVNFGENVHAGTLPPPLFEQYHLPACQRRCDKLHRAGKHVISHWDGDTKPLLPYAHATRLDGIEAITPVPQGDVTLDEMREALGDDLFLWDGIPAIYFDDIFPVETLVACTERLIELFAPKLVLGISDEISSTGDIERVRLVREIVDRYNEEQEAKAARV
jgi:hypothetical protein